MLAVLSVLGLLALIFYIHGNNNKIIIKKKKYICMFLVDSRHLIFLLLGFFLFSFCFLKAT